MRKGAWWLPVSALLFSAGLAGAESCPPPLREKWVNVCETVQVEVPVVEYVEEPCEVRVTRMVPVEKDVEVKSGKWIYEEKETPCVRKVSVCEEYQATETRYETRSETRVRKVATWVYDETEKVVVDRVPEEVCDPVTGRIRRVWREECRTVKVPVRRQVLADEEYSVDVKCPVQVPVTRTRQVIKEVAENRLVRTPKYVCEVVTRKVKVLEPRVETKTVMKKRAVRTTKLVERQVVKRVKVAAEPPC